MAEYEETRDKFLSFLIDMPKIINENAKEINRKIMRKQRDLCPLSV
jgi:hypothetical protein